MRHEIAIAVLAALAIGTPARAGVTYDKLRTKLVDASSEASITVEAPLGQGQPIVVENLIGSLSLEGNGPEGKVVVEAQIVADAATPDLARELAASVTLERADAGGAVVLRTGLPVDRGLSFRFPRSEADGPFARWISPLIRRGRVAYPWEGATVTVGNERGATALAVHLAVKVPAGALVTLRQIAGGIRTARTRGSILLDNVDGGVISEQTYGSLDARSSGGEVVIRTFRGESLSIRTSGRDVEIVDVRAERMRLATGNGWVRGRLIDAGDLVVESTEGAVELQGAEARTFRIVTGTGGIDVTSALKGTREASFKSASGDVVLRVPPIARFDLDARSGKGSIQTKGLEGLETVSADRTQARYRFRGGGAALRLESETGGVAIAGTK